MTPTVIESEGYFTARVTAELVRNGSRGSAWGCPIALALEDLELVTSSREPLRVAVSNGATWYEGPRAVLVAELSAAILNKVCAWDQGGRMAPFNFRVRVRRLAPLLGASS